MLIARLEEARFQEIENLIKVSDPEAKWTAYAKAFREAGIDPLSGNPMTVSTLLIGREKVDRIAAVLDEWARHLSARDRGGRLSAIARSITSKRLHEALDRGDVDALMARLKEGEELYRVAADLDDWARRLSGHDRAAKLYTIARAIDPDRNRIREVIRRGDRAELTALSKQASISHLPAVSVLMLKDALLNVGAKEMAIELLIGAQRRFPNDFWVNYDLGSLLWLKGPPGEQDGLRFLTVAVALNPDSTGPLSMLGYRLGQSGKKGEAIAAFQRARCLSDSSASTRTHIGLGFVLCGEQGEAVISFREAIRLQPDYAWAHYNLGLALANQGKWQEADLACRGAIRLASVNSSGIMKALGVGNYQEYSSGRYLLTLGQSCYDKRKYATSARLWSEALAVIPGLADNRQAGHRYNAACSAAQAGSGNGEDDPRPDESAKAAFRRQSSEWLHAELSAWSKIAQTVGPGNPETVAKTLTHWKEDADLAGVRDEKELAKLPEAERAEWRALWAEVDALLAKVSKP